MNLSADIVTWFQARAGLMGMGGPFQDFTPPDKRETYPRATFTFLPTSGKQKRAWGSRIETVDVRFEMFDEGDAAAKVLQTALETAITTAKADMAMTSGVLGDCEQISSYTRRAGKNAKGNEIYMASVTARFTVERRP